jgi:2-polyprenyl-3-methyl-5-hydroxy-6-metoxy-1,4-benzoquinol methylase
MLSRIDHIEEKYYEERLENKNYIVCNSEASSPRLDDNIRRATDFGSYIRNKFWLDFGCGLGGMLHEMGSEAQWAAGLEPNKERASTVIKKGINVIETLDEIKSIHLDIVTMFHVLEHLTEPLNILSKVCASLKPGGTLLIEVPHARDALFTMYNCDAFKKFTFWSEHLILHTRLSLGSMLKKAGFEKIEIIGYQRYPLENHLYWLAKHQPGGHDIWKFMSTKGLRSEYEASLQKIDRTDTLIAICHRPLK